MVVFFYRATLCVIAALAVSGQARITLGIGPMHCTTVGPSISHLSPNYTENKYVKRVTIFFSVYSKQVKCSTVRLLREIDA